MSSMAPRPILKRSAHYQANNHPPEHNVHGVHFPPPLNLTRTFDTHSSTIYDRSPIMVTPNSCALPERGCPGRTYHSLEEPASTSYFSSLKPQPLSRGHAHPRALARQVSAPPFAPVPPLVPDLSSESDESDGFSNYPPNLQPSFRPTPSPPKYPSSYNTPPPTYEPHPSYFPMNPAYPPALSPPYLVPHPQQPVPMSHSYSQYSQSQAEKTRRRRDRSSQRQKEWDYRIRNAQDVEADDPGYDDDADIAAPLSSSPERKKTSHRRTTSMSSICKTFSGFGLQEESGGCLGGF